MESRRFFLEALERSLAEGTLDPIANVVRWPGYRRRLRQKIARWGMSRRRREAVDREDPLALAEWRVFEQYETLLREHAAVDAQGLEAWASSLAWTDHGLLGAMSGIVVLNLEFAPRAAWRWLARSGDYPGAIAATLAIGDVDESSTLDEPRQSVFGRLGKLGFETRACVPAAERPGGISGLEQTLFRGGRARVATADGVTIRGLPQGEETADAVARLVQSALERGIEPGAILLVARRLRDQADMVAQALEERGFAVDPHDERALAHDPAVFALFSAAGLPPAQFEVIELARVLRHGLVRPPGFDPLDLARAARAVERTSRYRDRQAIERGLEAAVAASRQRKHPPVKPARLEDLERGRAAAVQFLALFDELDTERTWNGQLERLRAFAATLGLDQPDLSGIHSLFQALEADASAHARLSPADQLVSWGEFVRQAQELAADTIAPRPAPRADAIRLMPLEAAPGLQPRLLVLFDLEEGTFPTRDAVAALARVRIGRKPGAGARRSLEREMVRLIDMIGSASEYVCLFYPTVDEKGRETIRAGFLDDVLDRFEPAARRACQEAQPRWMLAPPSPRRRRIETLLAARRQGNLDPLKRLAADPEHRPALLGAAIGLHLLARRARGRPFGEYEGRLSDGEAVLQLHDLFGPRHAFSPSQFDHYIDCPFKFFARYVLELEPPQKRGEFEEDHGTQGVKVHHLLERFERNPASGLDDEQAATQFIYQSLDDLDQLGLSPGEIMIERRRLFLLFQKFLEERQTYHASEAVRPSVLDLEVAIGRDESTRANLGDKRRQVTVQGIIDRIDILETNDGTRFRIIDYKTADPPGLTKVKHGQRIQLLIYALAVAQVELAGSGVAPHDVGYWGVGRKGFEPIRVEDWNALAEGVGSYLVDLVQAMQAGKFDVSPRSRDDGCEHHCDFRGVCRIAQVRGSWKRQERVIAPELPGVSGSKKSAAKKT